MGTKVVFPSETFLTDATLKTFLPCMYPPVIGETACVRIFLFASLIGTLVRFYLHMDVLMYLQIAFLGEDFTASGAFVAWHTCCSRFYVSSQYLEKRNIQNTSIYLNHRSVMHSPFMLMPSPVSNTALCSAQCCQQLHTLILIMCEFIFFISLKLLTSK